MLYYPSGSVGDGYVGKGSGETAHPVAPYVRVKFQTLVIVMDAAAALDPPWLSWMV